MTDHTADRIAEDLARNQFGIITRTQAQACGLSARQIDHRVRSGAWVRRYPGVYAMRAATDSWLGDVLAAALDTGGVASHRCAAALWELEIFDEPPVEIAVRKDKRSDHSTRLHQTTQWDLRDETLLSGIPCTGIERTLLDCAAVVSFRKLERLCEVAIRKNFTSWTQLAHALSIHSRQGRNGCGPMRRLLEFRLGDRTIPLSDFSRLIVQLLEANGIPKPKVEYRIVDEAGDLVLQTDLAWPRRKKAWELDGLAFHFGRTDVERDRRKRNRAIGLGWTIQEVLWSMYVDNPGQLVTMAKQFLEI